MGNRPDPLLLLQFLQAKDKPADLPSRDRMENSRLYDFLRQIWQRNLELENRLAVLEGAESPAVVIPVTPGAVTVGNTTVNFGVAPGGSNIATTTIVGQAGILATSFIFATIGYSSTGQHTEGEHILFDGYVRVSNVIPGTGFTINVWSTQRYNGRFNVQWIWSN